MRRKKTNLSTMSSKNMAFFGIILIFFLLMLQSAAALFFSNASEEITQIDIVFRTALSSIFGYIMSMVSTSDFTIKEKIKREPVSTPKPPPNPIPKPTEIEIKQAELPPQALEKKKIIVNVQIIVLTSVCVFCLIILLIVRNFSEMIVITDSNIVTISQYRDIISGSIGALIGLSRNNNSQ